MAVTVDSAALRNALRLGDTAAEVADSERLLSFATSAVLKHAPRAPDVAHNEAVVRLAGYLADMPNAGRGSGYADALRNSGARAILLPWREHRARATGPATATATATTPAAPGEGITTAQVQLLIDASIDAHATLPNVHHVPTPAAPAGFAESGDESVSVATANQWVSTALPYPESFVFGVKVDGHPLALGLTADLPDAGVSAGADATAALNGRLFALGADGVGGVIHFAASTGTYAVRLFEHA